MATQAFEVSTNEGFIRSEGLTLPGRAFISTRSFAAVFPKKERPANRPAWGYPGFIVAPKVAQAKLSRKAPDHQVIGDLYAFLRQQWHITAGVKNETVKMTRAVIEARAAAHMLLNKGHCPKSEHDEIMKRIRVLEDAFTDPDFRDDRKIKAGDLFMQVAIEPDRDPRKNAVHAMATFAGARHLEARKKLTLLMSCYLNPRFLQVRGVVRQLEERLDHMKMKLSKNSSLRMAHVSYKARSDRQSRNRLIADIGFLEQDLFHFAHILPFAPQARVARADCLSMRMEITSKSGPNFDKFEALLEDLLFRVTMLRLIVAVERDVILPLTVLKLHKPEPGDEEHRRQIFAATQEDIRKLFDRIQAESDKSLKRLKELSFWISKLDFCKRNKFEDHRIVRDDAKKFVEYLVLAALPEG